jgi:hypothetical protein
MGCDIHLHTEVKIEGKWRHWGNPDIDRWYALFEKMAGVRGELSNAISAPKGLPEDMTFETKFAYDWWGGGMHSESWLNAEEIAKLCKWWRENTSECLEHMFGYVIGSDWDVIRDTEIEDIRWVFWFDN